jgi:hypothetical protein
MAGGYIISLVAAEHRGTKIPHFDTNSNDGVHFNHWLTYNRSFWVREA